MADYPVAAAEFHFRLKDGVPSFGVEVERRLIKLWDSIPCIRNVLVAFEKQDLCGEREAQNYQLVYNTLWEKYHKACKAQHESATDDIALEMELVKQVDVGIDYILMLVAKYHDANCQDKEIRADIDYAIDSSPTLRDKRELIERFIDSVDVTGTCREAWEGYVRETGGAVMDILPRGGGSSLFSRVATGIVATKERVLGKF